MLAWFGKRASVRTTAGELYGSSVAQARDKTFYAVWGVPDTVEGRFEVLALHLFLLTSRLQQDGRPGAKLARAVLETCITDLDDSMREEGVADIRVPKFVKKAAAGLYDRFNDYRTALAAADNAPLEKTLDGHFGQLAPSDDATSSNEPPNGISIDTAALANYMRDTAAQLKQQTTADLGAGKVDFPELAN